jgi:hypothetical protein
MKTIKLTESDLIKLVKKVLSEQPVDNSPELNNDMTDRYMFFSNLEQIHRQTGLLLEQNKEEIHDILEGGHDWAQDHIATAKESIDQVFDFLMNETKREEMMGMEEMMNEGKLDFIKGKKIHLLTNRDDNDEVVGHIRGIEMYGGYTPVMEIDLDDTGHNYAIVMYNKRKDAFIDANVGSIIYTPKTEKDERLLNLFRINYYDIEDNDDILEEGKKKSGTKLCARGKAAAKAKFKVYPSAYSNGFAVQVCKGRMRGLDGKKRCSPPYC